MPSTWWLRASCAANFVCGNNEKQEKKSGKTWEYGSSAPLEEQPSARPAVRHAAGRVSLSRRYRRRLSQPNIRWKTLDEIYQVYELLHIPSRGEIVPVGTEAPNRKTRKSVQNLMCFPSGNPRGSGVRTPKPCRSALIYGSAPRPRARATPRQSAGRRRHRSILRALDLRNALSNQGRWL